MNVVRALTHLLTVVASATLASCHVALKLIPKLTNVLVSLALSRNRDGGICLRIIFTPSVMYLMHELHAAKS